MARPLAFAPLAGQPVGARDVFLEMGLDSWVKTSGSKGFHIVTPMVGPSDFGKAAALADRVARILVERDPKHLTQVFSKADRGGRLLIDTARNHAGATFAAPYTVRARPGAPVSAPCTWDELEAGVVGPRTFDLYSMPQRVLDVGDLWQGLLPPKRVQK